MTNIYSVLENSECCYVFNDITSTKQRTKVFIPTVFHAVKKNNIKLVLKALNDGLSPNVEFKGNTLLNYSIYFDKLEIANLLIKNGADPYKKSEAYNMNAFDEAKNKPNILNILQK